MSSNSNRDLRPNLVVFGYANHDLNRYPDGTEQRCVGGGGYFAALAASRIVSDVGFVTRVGRDFDLGVLSKYVSSQAITVMPDGVTACSIQTYNDLENLSDRSIELIPGVNPSLSAADIPSTWLDTASFVLVSTMVPLQHRSVVDAIVSQKRQEKITLAGLEFSAPVVAVDSDLCWLQDEGNRETVSNAMMSADVVFMNRAEREILKDLIPQIPISVLKRDAEGAEILLRGEVIAALTAPLVKVTDVTGAGDVFAGTLLASLAKGSSLEASLDRAINAASMSIAEEGIEHLMSTPA